MSVNSRHTHLPRVSQMSCWSSVAPLLCCSPPWWRGCRGCKAGGPAGGPRYGSHWTSKPAPPDPSPPRSHAGRARDDSRPRATTTMFSLICFCLNDFLLVCYLPNTVTQRCDSAEGCFIKEAQKSSVNCETPLCTQTRTQLDMHANIGCFSNVQLHSLWKILTVVSRPGSKAHFIQHTSLCFLWAKV